MRRQGNVPDAEGEAPPAGESVTPRERREEARWEGEGRSGRVRESGWGRSI